MGRSVGLKKRLSLFPPQYRWCQQLGWHNLSRCKILISVAIPVENDGTLSWHVLGLDESKQEIRQNSHRMTERLHGSAEIVFSRAKLMTVPVPAD